MQIIYEPKGKAGEYARLAVNLYDGCSNRCKYCYAPQIRRRTPEDFHSNIRIVKNGLERLEADCKRLQKHGWKGKPAPAILLSFLTDPYQPIEWTERVTGRAIRIIHSYGLSVQILTKAPVLASIDFDQLTERDSFAVTLTFMDDDNSREWEPGADSPEVRVIALEFAHNLGIPTWASLEPVIDPEQSLELIQASSAFVDFYKVGRWNHDLRANDIDWHDFGHRAVALLDKLGKSYLIKKDLAKEMEG